MWLSGSGHMLDFFEDHGPGLFHNILDIGIAEGAFLKRAGGEAAQETVLEFVEI